ncbi:MAG: hypothetical protein K9M57_04230 [Phycisphaerae bacterium]|nr:hypothetical protein [Phycisphaerae bacterium]
MMSLMSKKGFGCPLFFGASDPYPVEPTTPPAIIIERVYNRLFRCGKKVLPPPTGADGQVIQCIDVTPQVYRTCPSSVGSNASLQKRETRGGSSWSNISHTSIIGLQVVADRGHRKKTPSPYKVCAPPLKRTSKTTQSFTAVLS